MPIQDKRGNTTSVSSNYAEPQIAAEILASGQARFEQCPDCKDSSFAIRGCPACTSSLFAIRVISTNVTFYRADISTSYWRELEEGLPKSEFVEILRWPPADILAKGYDLIEPDHRRIVFQALAGIREYLVKDTRPSRTAQRNARVTCDTPTMT